MAEPTKASVLARLVHHPIAHFSCHGATYPHQPSLSRLLLSDHEHDPLTAASLAPVALDRAQLAYLSACNTAATRPMICSTSRSIWLRRSRSPVSHMSSARCGRSTISPRIADDFYARLRTPEDDLDVSRAAQALHRATLHARSGDGTTDEPADALLNPFLWASYVHIGI
ncbi:CHAT domain-containing protein [Streptomyces tanashiensis]